MILRFRIVVNTGHCLGEYMIIGYLAPLGNLDNLGLHGLAQGSAT